ncbi:MAG: DegT/DnrJ/EryC1/StrS aminotransferase family protein [Thermoanaerobaculia bacterium]
MRDTFLEFSPPCLGEEEIAEVVDALRSGWITTGPKVRRFEGEFASAVGAESALAVASATDAMQVGLAAAGIGPGDEVITTPMTFSSTVHVIEHVGATPVLVDVEPDTLCVDPGQIEKAITARTRALLPVHLYGHPCEMGRILDLARANDLTVLEDAAHALPASYQGRSVGSIGDLTAFSFYSTKNLTTGEGGMLTGDAELIERARPWALHGMTRDALSRYGEEGSWYYEVVLPGFKCNMTDIQAGLGLQQLRKLPRFQERRREVAERYSQALAELPEIEIPVERDGCESAWHIFAIRLRLERLQIDRAQFIEELTRRRIGTSVHFIPVHLHPYYRDKYGFRPEDFPVTWESYRRLVSLPLHPGLTEKDVEDVIEAVTDVVARFRR